MARLKWGQLQNRIVETGVSKCVLYPKGSSGVVWDGVISVSSGFDGGDETDLYSNNKAYAKLVGMERYTGTIESYAIPDEMKKCVGRRTLASGIVVSQQKRLYFGLSYRTEILDSNSMPKGYKIHLIYNAVGKPSEITYQTEGDSPDPLTYSFDFTTLPVDMDDYEQFSEIIIDSTTVDPINLEELERILYGLGEDEPTLPGPDYVLNMINMNKVVRMIVDALSLHGHWIWDEFNFDVDTVPIAVDRESKRHVFKNADESTEFIQPSVSFKLLHADKTSQTYSVEVIDSKETSELSENLETELNLLKDVDDLSGDWITPTDSKGFVHYPYILTL